ncbi:hypothetical protein [Streptomyces sp. NPDC056255]|uniref:hypothetical protein n=1 Tax=Streptomyces sp. NPDC056255 TaxID=3345764 RepID=UPI0035DA678C
MATSLRNSANGATIDPASVSDHDPSPIRTGANSDDHHSGPADRTGPWSATRLYDVFNRPSRLEYGATLGKNAYKSLEYDEHTGLLVQQTTDRDLAPQHVDDTTYAYDPAGNVSGVTTASGQDTQKSVDTQCFTTDLLGRLTEAWKATADCARTDPTGTAVEATTLTGRATAATNPATAPA